MCPVQFYAISESAPLKLITPTPGFNLGYLTPPPGQFFMGTKLSIGTPRM